MRPFSLGALASAALLVACKSNPVVVASDAAAPTASVAAAPSASAPKRIECKSDADCPLRACGPCKPGELVDPALTRIECYRNPCTNSRSVCNPQGYCAVHPDTRFYDDLKSAECQKLARDKWASLCKDKTGSVRTECENVVDGATARDDDAGCKSARARLLK